MGFTAARTSLVVLLSAIGVAIAVVGRSEPSSAPSPAAARPRPANGDPVPWLTLWSQKFGKTTWQVNYITSGSVETIVLVAKTADALANVREDPETHERALADDQKWFLSKGTRLFVRRGKKPGRALSKEQFPYRSTFHRVKIDHPRGVPFAYCVYRGKGFTQPFEVPIADAKLGFSAVHVGHTSALPGRGAKEWEFYPEHLIDFITSQSPSLMLHSGDAFVSAFDWELARRETLDTFSSVLPKLPILISPANHDLGWPQSRRGEQPEFFRYLFQYPYEDDTLHYKVDYEGFRFVVINYLDLSKDGKREKAHALVEQWVSETKNPVVLLWGGSKMSLWAPMAAFATRHPNLRLILGGDGGRFRWEALDHGAYLVHNEPRGVVAMRFTESTIHLRCYADRRVKKSLRVQTRAK